MLIHVTGSDSFRARQAIGQITAKYRLKNPDLTELVTFDPENSPTDWGGLSVVPLFASSRLVVIKEALKLPAVSLMALMAALPSLPATTVVIIWDGGPVPAKSPLSELAPTKTIDASPLSGPALRRWIKDQAAQQAVELSTETLQTLIDEYGSDLWAIDTALAALALGAAASGSKKTLSEPFAVFRLIRAHDIPGLHGYLRVEYTAGTPIELLIGSLAAAIRKVQPTAWHEAMVDLLADIDIGLKTGVLVADQAMAVLLGHLSKPAGHRVQWERVWLETVS